MSISMLYKSIPILYVHLYALQPHFLLSWKPPLSSLSLTEHLHLWYSNTAPHPQPKHIISGLQVESLLLCVSFSYV